MKRVSIFASLLFGSALFLQAQNASSSPGNDRTPQSAQNDATARNVSAAEEMKGNAQIQSDLMMSFGDHNLSGVSVKVTDDAIELSGKLPDKSDQQLAHDLAAAYTDGRKLHDRITR